MLGELKDLAAIDALALEDGARVMQRVGEDMHLGVGPRDQLAIQPNDALALIVGLRCHRNDPPRAWAGGTRPRKLVLLCPQAPLAQHCEEKLGKISMELSQQG